ncbi:hypothetical protein OJ996_11765 [Luteolibacter sp. GHJ8]|uniref:Uncharacterized protein n=1 Tax=Luteolibacter rhizosphaerae TaxID=2989719 RepID=A0ABT3G321_9BACT|nr:hypothetical protein [Luteolibacter rhizosphaerae]
MFRSLRFAVRAVCLLTVIFLASCKTGGYHYGKSNFTLSPGFSRIHSPGSFTAITRSATSPEMFSVVWATHGQDPFKLTPQQWYREGDAALRTLNVHKGFSNAREISRSIGQSGRFRTMDHVLSGTMNNSAYVSSDMVMSSRLYHSRDEVYFFFLAQFRSAHAADPSRFSRIMDSVHFDE